MAPVRELEEKLRGLIWERIQEGALTEVALAARSGFRQAYISQFLNRRRGLSLAGMDRLLEAEALSIADLLGPQKEDPEYERVPLLAAEHAVEPRTGQFASATIKLKRAVLDSFRTSVLGNARWGWDRFVLIRADSGDVEAMYPRLPAACTALIDRHYNSLEPYRRGERSMFAVWTGESVVIRCATAIRGELLLRAEDPRLWTETIAVPQGKEFHELVAGRVAWIAAEM